MQLVGPFKVRLECGTDQGGKIVMNRSIDDGDSSIPFLLSLLGSSKKKNSRQLAFEYEPPSEGPVPDVPAEEPETAPPPSEDGQEQPPAGEGASGYVCDLCGADVAATAVGELPPDYCERCEAKRCPQCDTIEPGNIVDIDTGAAGYVCGSCGTRYGFTCAEPGCDGPANQYGRCEKHQPGYALPKTTEPKRKRASGRRKKTPEPTEPCGHDTANPSGICDDCIEKKMEAEK